jgi:hypothetical protein
MAALRWPVLGFVLALCISPSPTSAEDKETASVEGTITFKDAPVPDGKVGFHPEKGKPVFAEIKDGKYAARGVPVGRHSVTVEGKSVRLPKEYASPDTTALRFEATKGKHVFDIRLQ